MSSIISDFVKRTPSIYEDNGIRIGIDIDYRSFYIYTDKYCIDWYWKSKQFQVIDQQDPRHPEIFFSRVDSALDEFCQFDYTGKYIIHSCAEEVHAFVDRLLKLRVFL